MNIEISANDLHKELTKMPEFVLLGQIRHFNSSIEIFNGNYRQLKKHIEFHNNPMKSNELLKVNNREILHEFQQETIRLLHNYVASAFSLIDHTRRHYNTLYSKNLKFPEYKEEVKKRFNKIPVAIFTKDLRQFIQHYDLPAISSKTSFSANPRSLTQTLNIIFKEEDLKKFNWSKLSKEYLSLNENEIELEDFIFSYFEIVKDFYNWFKQKQEKLHSNEIEIIKKKKRKIANLTAPKLINAILSFPDCNYMNFEIHISSILTKEQQSELSLINNMKLRFEKLLSFFKNKFTLSKALSDRIKMLYLDC